MQGFPPGWTRQDGVPERFRYFAMGNALVVSLVTRMGRRLLEFDAGESGAEPSGAYQPLWLEPRLPG